MVVIRLSRAGAKKCPFYHVVVTNKANSRDGRFIERVGFYNPIPRGKAIELNLDIERIQYWLGQGAQASDCVSALISRHKKSAAAAVAA